MNNTNSNINIYYEETIKDLAERANSYIENGTEDEGEAINYAMDDALIYYVDQAYIVAYYMITYCPKWTDGINFDDVYMMLYDDIAEELQNLKKEA